MKKQTNGNILFTMMVGIRSKFSRQFCLSIRFLSYRWDTWAHADVLQKRTEKTEELFNKMNVAV